VIGSPATSRFFGDDGFLYQATQAALLQWSPATGEVRLANTFEMLERAGVDDILLTRGIPKPITDDGSGGDFTRAKEVRLSWLTDEAIKAKYLAVGGVEQAIAIYGLPMSRPERIGPFIVQRFQRVAFQHWVQEVPGAPSVGSVTAILGGDLLKEFGLLPIRAQQPHTLEQSEEVSQFPIGFRHPPGLPTVTPTPRLSPTPRATPSPDVRVKIEGREFKIEGPVEAVEAAGITVAGFEIVVDFRRSGHLEIKGVVEVGAAVEVKGKVEADGTLVATKIEVKKSGPPAKKTGLERAQEKVQDALERRKAKDRSEKAGEDEEEDD